MAKVIKGHFPRMGKTAGKREDQALPAYIFLLSITFSEPLIWRRVQVPGGYTLRQMHDVIQACMGWSDSHIHQFLVGKIAYEPSGKQTALREAKRFDEYKYRLHRLEEGMQFLFTYLYGAGEGWEHDITLEEVLPPDSGKKDAVLLAGERACPPETMGDIHEYQRLLAQLEAPGGVKRSRLRELTGQEDFDPAHFDLAAARERLVEMSIATTTVR